jgi:DNA polymerase elongation subunit (family B)
MAYNAKINYEDVFSPVKMWDAIIYNHLLQKNIVVPQKSHSKKVEAFEGAFVKDPIIGAHNWVASFDLASLYPHLIMQYNMSPETLTDIRLDVDVERLLSAEFKMPYYPQDLAVTANGWCYRKDVRGFLPTLMEKMYEDRSKYKKQMLKVQQEFEHIESELDRRGLKY